MDPPTITQSQEQDVLAQINDMTLSGSDTVNVRSHIRRVPKSRKVVCSQKKQKHVKRINSGSLMDPGTFKLIIDHQKESIAEAKEHQIHDLTTIERKNTWSTFWNQATQKAKRRKRKKVKYVWEKKREAALHDRMDFINKIHDLDNPMMSDGDVDFDRYSADVEFAPLTNGTNINIDSSKPNHDEQQTQTESLTQLFEDSDVSDDDEGEFLFEE